VVLDPAEAKKRAIEAEEARLAAQRAHGTQVSPETFVTWRKQFDIEMVLQKTRFGAMTHCVEACIQLQMLGTNLLDYTRLHACTYNEHLTASCVRMLQSF